MIPAVGLSLLSFLSFLAGRSSLPGNVVDVVARDFFLKAPDTIPAGLTTLRLKVEQGAHMAILERLDSGYTAADLLRARRDGHPRPPWMHFVGGPGFPGPNGIANATMVLTPGHYVILCDVEDRDGVRHFEKGMFRPLVVRAVPAERGPAAQTPGSLPRADATVAMRDYSFTFSAPLRAGMRVLRVQNRGTVMHEFRVVHVLPGHTGKESLAWKPEDKTPRPDEDVAALVGIMPGGEIETTIAFEAGEYVVLCVPEIAHGMMQVVRVR
ncbi:MAG TPA: hypothetical protein VH277_17220 [Gemmatimonadaceae bacterium]|jgi:hypothetical protein|nr:hypothetical protein [Gemmatimonadaceae bacterium]